MKTVTLQLETLGCPSCVTKIEKALTSHEGVANAHVFFNSSKVKIEYDSSIIEKEHLSRIISNLGYEVIAELK